MKNSHLKRRDFLKDLGVSAAVLPFVAGLPDLCAAESEAKKQRLIIMAKANKKKAGPIEKRTLSADK